MTTWVSKFLWLNHKNMAFSLILAVRHSYFIVHNKLSLCNLCKVKKSLPHLIQVRNKFSPQFHWPKNDEDLAQNSTKVWVRWTEILSNRFIEMRTCQWNTFKLNLFSMVINIYSKNPQVRLEPTFSRVSLNRFLHKWWLT